MKYLCSGLLALILALAMVLTMGLVSAFAEDELVDGKFAEPRHITVRLFQRGEYHLPVLRLIAHDDVLGK